MCFFQPELSAWDRFYATFDADEIFAFETPKVMRLLDRRLGFCSVTVKGIIWSYMIFVVLIGEGKPLNASAVALQQRAHRHTFLLDSARRSMAE